MNIIEFNKIINELQAEIKFTPKINGFNIGISKKISENTTIYFDADFTNEEFVNDILFQNKFNQLVKDSNIGATTHF